MEGLKACAISLVILLLAACAPLRTGDQSHWRDNEAGLAIPPTDVSGPVEPLYDLSGLLQYAERVRGARPEALQQEHAAAERALTQDGNVATRMRLALLLAIPGTSFRNDARSQELLRRVLRDPSYNAHSYKALATLLIAQLNERREMERSLDEERRLRHALQRQLNELKAIEAEMDRQSAPKIVPP